MLGGTGRYWWVSGVGDAGERWEQQVSAAAGGSGRWGAGGRGSRRVPMGTGSCHWVLRTGRWEQRKLVGADSGGMLAGTGRGWWVL